MRQLIIFIFMAFLFTDSFAQLGFSISVDDTLKYQFQNEGNIVKLNIGTINYGQRPTDFNFYITNNSDTPLVINHANWAEPILAPTFNQSPIFKGQTGLIKYRLLETRRPGPFSKTATVKTNLGTFYIMFTGYNLPSTIYLDNLIQFDTVALGEKIYAEFKIYNKSDTSSLKIESVQCDWKTSISYDDDEVNKNENLIPPNSYRTFKVLFIPYQIGICSSKINITVSENSNTHISKWGERNVVYKIFATVIKPKKR